MRSPCSVGNQQSKASMGLTSESSIRSIAAHWQSSPGLELSSPELESRLIEGHASASRGKKAKSFDASYTASSEHIPS